MAALRLGWAGHAGSREDLGAVKMKEITESEDANRSDPISRRILFMHRRNKMLELEGQVD